MRDLFRPSGPILFFGGRAAGQRVERDTFYIAESTGRSHCRAVLQRAEQIELGVSL